MDDDSQRKMAEPARMLVVIFIQTLKAFRLYERDHPILTKFLDRVRKAFIRYFDDFEVFSLQIKETQILHRKRIVYESTDMKESLAFLFFRDGIREMRFHKGLDFNELLAFLNIVKKSDLINRLKDDLVTLIWQANFSLIDITTVEDFLENTGTAISTDKGLPAQGSGFGLQAGPGQQADSGAPAQAFIIEGFSPETLPSTDQTLIEACQLNIQETDKINLETEQEENPDLVSLVDDLIEILLHLSEKMEAYENIISYFEQVFLKFLEWGEMEKMAAILKNLNQLLETMALREKQVFAIRRILEIPSGPEHVRFLGATMKGEQGRSPFVDPDLPVLNQTGHPTPLSTCIRSYVPGNGKIPLRSHLIDLSREGIEPLAKLIPESKPSLILRIFDILKEARHPSTLKIFKTLSPP